MRVLNTSLKPLILYTYVQNFPLGFSQPARLKNLKGLDRLPVSKTFKKETSLYVANSSRNFKVFKEILTRFVISEDPILSMIQCIAMSPSFKTAVYHDFILYNYPLYL
jgi:hypothetical protein